MNPYSKKNEMMAHMVFQEGFDSGYLKGLKVARNEIADFKKEVVCEQAMTADIALDNINYILSLFENKYKQEIIDGR